MDRIRVLIVDDEPPARKRLRGLLERRSDVQVLGECADGVEALRFLELSEPDLLFLDVQMPGMTGLELIEAIGIQNAPAIVFVTAYDEFAVRAFELHAVEYLLKPFDDDRFERAMEHIVGVIARGERQAGLAPAVDQLRSPTVQRIPVRLSGSIRIIEVDDVEFFEADGNYVRIHAAESAPLMRDSLSALERRLNAEEFLRVHRGAIVRISAIRKLEPLFHGEYKITLASGKTLRSSRRSRAALHDALGLD